MDIPNRFPIVSTNVSGCRNRAIINSTPANTTPDVTTTKLPYRRKVTKMMSDTISNPTTAKPSVTDARERVSTLLVLDRIKYTRLPANAKGIMKYKGIVPKLPSPGSLH